MSMRREYVESLLTGLQIFLGTALMGYGFGTNRMLLLIAGTLLTALGMMIFLIRIY
jgi:hypothetical protein